MLVELAAVKKTWYDDDAQHDLDSLLLLLYPREGVWMSEIGVSVFE